MPVSYLMFPIIPNDNINESVECSITSFRVFHVSHSHSLLNFFFFKEILNIGDKALSEMLKVPEH